MNLLTELFPYEASEVDNEMANYIIDVLYREHYVRLVTIDEKHPAIKAADIPDSAFGTPLYLN